MKWVRNIFFKVSFSFLNMNVCVCLSLYIYLSIYIYIYIYLISNSVGVEKKKHRLYNLQILQTDILEKNFVSKKDEKHTCYLKIIK